MTTEKLRRIIDGLARLPVACDCRDRARAGSNPKRWAGSHHGRCPVPRRMLLLARYNATRPVATDEHHVMHGRPEWGRWRWVPDLGEWRVSI